jgi:hypothetical protein
MVGVYSVDGTGKPDERLLADWLKNRPLYVTDTTSNSVRVTRRPAL